MKPQVGLQLESCGEGYSVAVAWSALMPRHSTFLMLSRQQLLVHGADQRCLRKEYSGECGEFPSAQNFAFVCKPQQLANVESLSFMEAGVWDVHGGSFPALKPLPVHQARMQSIQANKTQGGINFTLFRLPLISDWLPLKYVISELLEHR